MRQLGSVASMSYESEDNPFITWTLHQAFAKAMLIAHAHAQHYLPAQAQDRDITES